MSGVAFELDRDSPTARGLIGLWGPGSPSGSTWFDRSGRGNHGTIDGPSWILDPERGWVLDFDGVNDSVDQANARGFNAAADFSVSMWVKVTTANLTDAIIGNHTGAGGWFVFNYGGALGMFVGGSGASNLCVASSDFTVGAWVHLGMTYHLAATEADFYYDGVFINTEGHTAGTLGSASTVLDIGERTGGYDLTAQLSDIRYYNWALSAAEFNHIYQSTRREPYSDLLLRPQRIFKAPAAAGGAPKRHRLLVSPVAGDTWKIST